MTPTFHSEESHPPPERKHEADLEFVRAVLRGDPGAGEELEKRLQRIPAVLRVQNSRLGSPLNEQELEDLVQETLTTVWERLETYGGHSAFETWCTGISLNHMKNALRKKRNGPRLVSETSEELLELTSEDEQDFDRFEALNRCLSELDERTLQVIGLRFFSELTFGRIGMELAMPENTVKTAYYRGLQRLRERLGGGDFSGVEG